MTLMVDIDFFLKKVKGKERDLSRDGAHKITRDTFKL
jgi:hypothetical protein